MPVPQKPLSATAFWGHRGLPQSYPENTLASFRAAAAAGVRWIETDVDISKDGTLIICHDQTLDRTTDHRGLVANLTATQRQKIDAGSWFNRDFKAEPLPVLSEVVQLCLATGMNLNLEIKPTAAGRLGAQRLVKACCAELAAFTDPQRVVISSFNPLLLNLAKSYAPQLPRAVLIHEDPEEYGWLTICELVEAAGIHPNQSHLNAELVAQMKAANLQVRPYTVNDAARANELFNFGVDAIFTDRADWFIHQRVAPNAASSA